MWRLVGETLRYYRTVVLVAWSIAFAAAATIQILALMGRTGERGAVGLVLFPLFVIIASMIAGIIVQAAESSEKRARLLLSLPLELADVAAARALSPLLILAAGVILSSAVQLGGAALGIESQLPFTALLFIAGQTGYYMYFASLFPEMGRLRQGGRRAALAGVAAVMVAGFAVLVWSQTSSYQDFGYYLFEQVPARTGIVLVPVFVNAALTYGLFRSRRSFVA